MTFNAPVSIPNRLLFHCRRLFRESAPVTLLDGKNLAQQAAHLGQEALHSGLLPGQSPRTLLLDPAALFTAPDTPSLYLFELTEDLLPKLEDFVLRHVNCADRSDPLKKSRVLLYGDSALLTRRLMAYTEVLSPEDPPTVVEQMAEECRLAYQAKTPLLLIDTQELELVERIVRQGDLLPLLEKNRDDSAPAAAFYQWLDSESDALTRCENVFFSMEEFEARRSDLHVPCLLLLHLEEDTATLIPKLRNYVKDYLHRPSNTDAAGCSTVILYGNVSLLPEDLIPYRKIVEEPYPKVREIAALLKTMAAENGTPFEYPEAWRRIAIEMAGFRLMQAQRVSRSLLWTDTVDGKAKLFHDDLRKELLQKEKCQMLLQTGGALTLVDPAPENGNVLCGMGAYQQWVNQKAAHMAAPEDYAFRRGVQPLKGLLMCGVPGCGKSEAAKILQRTWGLTLVRLNMDQLYGGRLGESEKNLRIALAQAEAMAPCIVYIDEIERGLGGASGEGGDGGTSQRMIGKLLTWLQDKRRACFVFATGNDISKLPQALLRRGRFDKLFSVYLPTEAQCISIFREHMRRAEELRRQEAQDRGQPLPTETLFQRGEEGPMGDACLKKIMELLAQKGMFLNGSDAAGLVSDGLTALSDRDLSEPISAARWFHVMADLAEDPTTDTFGSSESALEQIAAGYLRLLRGSFVPAAAGDDLLFHKQHYHSRSRGDQLPHYDDSNAPSTPRSPYDEALYQALKERINEGAPIYESWVRRQIWQA